jgi:hypothetical protein
MFEYNEQKDARISLECKWTVAISKGELHSQHSSDMNKYKKSWFSITRKNEPDFLYQLPNPLQNAKLFF